MSAIPESLSVSDSVRVQSEASAQAPSPPQRSRLWNAYQDSYNVIWGGLSFVIIIALWEFTTKVGLVNPFYVSSPSLVGVAMVEYFLTGDAFIDIRASGLEFAYGFAIAIGLGIPLGIIVGWYRYPYAWLNPFITALYSTPRISFAPLIIIWFGIGLQSKIFLVFFGALFPIALNTMVAFRTLDPDLMRMARSFKASDLQLFLTIALPGAIPVILTGIRLGIAGGLIGMIVGEFYASREGVGHWIQLAGNTLQSDKLFVGIIVIGVMGVGLSMLAGLIERRFDNWRVAVNDRDR